MGGAAEWDEANSVDISERRGEAWFGRNHAEAEAAMANSGEKKKGPRALEGVEAWGEAGEVRRDSGHALIAAGKALELTSELPTKL